MNWLKKLFTSRKIEELEDKIKELKNELEKRQEAINKTNAYWKKKIHEITRKKSLQK